MDWHEFPEVQYDGLGEPIDFDPKTSFVCKPSGSACNRIVSLRDSDYFFNEITRRRIVILGEGNGTFSLALFLLRGSTDEGLYVTCYDGTAPDVDGWLKAKLQLMAYVPFNWKTSNSPWQPDVELEAFMLAVMSQLLAWNNPTVHVGIDATDPESVVAATLESEMTTDNSVVFFFQCPWSDSTSSLVEAFLTGMSNSDAIPSGSIIALGIVASTKYFDTYGVCDKYRFKDFGTLTYIGADRRVISLLLAHGYKHEGRKDIHQKIMGNHLTLLYQKALSWDMN